MALKIKRKFIEDAAVDGLKLKLTSGQAVNLVKSDGSTEVRLIELDESSNKIKLGGATAALLSDVNDERALREAGDAAISGQIQTLIGSEADARANEDDAINARIDALEGPTGSIAAAIADEAAIRQDADDALDGRLDILEGSESQAGSVAKALKDAKDYADSQVADEAAIRQDADDALDGRLDILEGSDTQVGSVAKALKDAKDYADAGIADEAAIRQDADDALDGRLDILEGSDTQVGSVAKALKDAKAYTDSEVADEAAARQDADDALDGRLDIIEGPDTQVGSIAKALKDAKDYVNDVVGVSSAAVAAFASLSAQMVDGDAATGIINSLGSLDERLDTLEGADSVTGSVAKALKDAKAYTDSEVADEAAARQDADDALDGRLDILEGSDTQVGSVAKALKDAKDYADAGIADEAAARENADSDLQSELDATQTGAGLGADGSYSAPVGSNYLGSAVSLKSADSALDSAIKDIQDQIDSISGGGSGSLGSLNSELDDTQTGAGLNANGSYSAPVGSNYLGSAVSLKDADSKLDAAIKAEQERAVGEESALDGRLDILEGSDTQVGSVAKALKDAKAYTDSEVADEAAARQDADDALDGRLDILEGSESQVGSVAKALKDAKDYADSQVADEATARENADNDIKDRLDILEGSDTQVGSVAKALKDAKDYVNDVVGVSSAAVAAFASLSAQMVDGDAATGIITALGSVEERLDVIEGPDSQAGSVAKALKDAKAYTDSEVADEAATRQDADDALSVRLDSLEGNVHKKQKFVMGSSIPAYVDLDFIAMENSVVASVGRLMIHEGVGEDFTMSVVGGVSRLTFVGNLTSSSAEQLAEGDILYVKYVKA